MSSPQDGRDLVGLETMFQVADHSLQNNPAKAKTTHSIFQVGYHDISCQTWLRVRRVKAVQSCLSIATKLSFQTASRAVSMECEPCMPTEDGYQDQTV